MNDMANAFYEMARALAQVRRDHEELHRRVGNLIRPAKVKEVDAANYRVKLDLQPGESAADTFESDWVPWAEMAGAGAYNGAGDSGNDASTKTWFPPKVGSSVYLFSPFGEPGAGFAMGTTYTDENKPPSTSEEEAVVNRGNSRWSIKNGEIKTQVGSDCTITQTADSITAQKGTSIVKMEAGKITVTVDGKGFEVNPSEMQMTTVWKAKDPVGKPAHYVDGVDTGGDLAVDGNPNVIL